MSELETYKDALGCGQPEHKLSPQMGAFLSAPVLGYFLLPSFASYSASLNLLFFYMTWSTLVLSFSPLKVEVVGTLGVRAVFFLLPSLVFLLFDTIIPSLSVSIKTQGEAALPTRTANGGGKRRRSGTRAQWYSILGLSIFNNLLGVALQAGIEFLLTEVLQIRSALKLSTTLPMPWTIATGVARGLVLREILQYYIHRFFLHPASPNPVSDLHNSYHHSIKAPFSFVAHYDHPISWIFYRFLPTYLPSIIFRTHLLTYLLLLAIVTLEETITFSGYSSIPGILLGGIARRQDLHAQGHGRGNYAPWGFLDWLHGTSIGPDVIEDVKDEAEKHQVKERSGKAWGDAKETGREGISQGLKAWNGRRKSSRKA